MSNPETTIRARGIVRRIIRKELIAWGSCVIWHEDRGWFTSDFIIWSAPEWFVDRLLLATKVSSMLQERLR